MTRIKKAALEKLRDVKKCLDNFCEKMSKISKNFISLESNFFFLVELNLEIVPEHLF